jgi:hypothetical protein
MIGHEQCQMRVPDPSGVSVRYGFQHSRARIWNCELVFAALFAAERDEVPFLARIDPKRNVMRESPSNWSGRDRLGRDAALRRPQIVINLRVHSRAAACRPYLDHVHLDRQNMIDHVGSTIRVALEGLDATA